MIDTILLSPKGSSFSTECASRVPPDEALSDIFFSRNLEVARETFMQFSRDKLYIVTYLCRNCDVANNLHDFLLRCNVIM